MTPEEILATWERVHGPLDGGRRATFLSRPEVATLGDLPPAAVLAAVATSPRLSQIVGRAEASAWWFRGDACEEDGIVNCARCRPSTYPAVVVMTRGSSAAFHATEDCPLLASGQRRIAEGGGEPAAVERVPLQVALGAGRLPCQACFPPERR